MSHQPPIVLPVLPVLRSYLDSSAPGKSRNRNPRFLLLSQALDEISDPTGRSDPRACRQADSKITSVMLCFELTQLPEGMGVEQHSLLGQAWQASLDGVDDLVDAAARDRGGEKVEKESKKMVDRVKDVGAMVSDETLMADIAKLMDDVVQAMYQGREKTVLSGGCQ